MNDDLIPWLLRLMTAAVLIPNAMMLVYSATGGRIGFF